ncbi:MAG: AEC family transporter [Anaerovoracaceae bacterium]|nr:AEC family transporter [Bacillota bacterium]MDY2670867.1 AEC family transporter [Anaerovoracaceae bacterium]
MFSNFMVCLNAVLPIFILIFIGGCVRRFKLLSQEEVRRVNRFVFLVFFGPLMFENIYGSSHTGHINMSAVVYAFVFVLAEIAVITPAVMAIEKDNKKRGAMIQAMYRSNYIIMGLPVAMNIFGKGNVAMTTVMISVIVPLYNVMAVMILETFRGGHVSPISVIKKLARNPIIIGAVFGALATAADIKLPMAVDTVLSDMGSACTPIALIILGASFSFERIRGYAKNLTIVVVTRLVIVPAVGLTIAALIGFRGIDFISLLAMMTAPSAVSSYTMADAMDSDGALAGAAVIFTSGFSLMTMFLWLFIFKNLGMF